MCYELISLFIISSDVEQFDITQLCGPLPRAHGHSGPIYRGSVTYKVVWNYNHDIKTYTCNYRACWGFHRPFLPKAWSARQLVSPLFPRYFFRSSE